MSPSRDLIECLRLGFLHASSGRFLTAELFNSEINISGTALRRRQLWTLCSEPSRPDTIYLQSHLGRFLSADKDGKVSGSSMNTGCDERFLLEFAPEGTGEWALRSEVHGYYLTGTETQVSCFSKTPVWWAVRLAIHPQVHIRHQFRSRYLRLLPNVNELRADLAHPWGSETLLWIEQPNMVSNNCGGAKAVGRAAIAKLGRVAFRTLSGHYLQSNGDLVLELEDSALFSIELRPGNPKSFAFRDSKGTYLSTSGPGTVKVKSSAFTPGKEELFMIERTSLQMAILAHNGKFASVKQGIEISANQHEADETAIFKLEYVGGTGFNCSEHIAAAMTQLPQTAGGDTPALSSVTNGMTPGIFSLVTGFWRLRCRNGKLWRMAPSATVQSSASDGDADSLFEVLTLADKKQSVPGDVVFRSNCANGGQSLSARKLGAISTSGRSVMESDLPAPTDIFRLLLVNRPSIIFMSVFTGGFISRGKQRSNLDCSSMNYDSFDVRLTKNNTFQLFAREQNSSYLLWTAGADGCMQLKKTNRGPDESLENGFLESGTEFMFHFLDNHRTLIRAIGTECDSCMTLVKAESKGELKAEATSEMSVNFIWEI